MIINLCNLLFPLFKNRNVGILKNENFLIVKMNEEPDRKKAKSLHLKLLENGHSKKTS